MKLIRIERTMKLEVHLSGNEAQYFIAELRGLLREGDQAINELGDQYWQTLTTQTPGSIVVQIKDDDEPTYVGDVIIALETLELDVPDELREWETMLKELRAMRGTTGTDDRELRKAMREEQLVRRVELN